MEKAAVLTTQEQIPINQNACAHYALFSTGRRNNISRSRARVGRLVCSSSFSSCEVYFLKPYRILIDVSINGARPLYPPLEVYVNDGDNVHIQQEVRAEFTAVGFPTQNRRWGGCDTGTCTHTESEHRVLDGNR